MIISSAISKIVSSVVLSVVVFAITSCRNNRAISAVISNHLHLNWLTKVEDMSIGIDHNYEWLPVEGESDVHIVWEINYEAMKEDYFSTINGNPRKLVKH